MQDLSQKTCCYEKPKFVRAKTFTIKSFSRGCVKDRSNYEALHCTQVLWPGNAVLLVNASTRKLKGTIVFSCPTVNDLEDKETNTCPCLEILSDTAYFNWSKNCVCSTFPSYVIRVFITYFHQY